MPDDRFLHRRAGHGTKPNMLTDLEHRVWMQYLLSADDFGVMRGTHHPVQNDNDSLASRPAKAIQRSIDALVRVGLIRTFEHQGKPYVYQHDWQTWQKVSYPRGTTQPAPPPEALAECDEATRLLFEQHPGGRKPGTASSGPLAQNEIHLRGLLAAGLPSAWPSVSAISENVRLGNSYADLVVTITDRRMAVIEVKRTLIYKAAITQVRGYGDIIRSQYPGYGLSLVVIGRGVSESVTTDLPVDVTLVVVDDSLLCSVSHRVGNIDLPDKFSVDPKYLTVNSVGETTRADAPAKRLTANGIRLVANGSEGGLGGTDPPLDLWFNELHGAYPLKAVSRGLLTQQAFMQAVLRHGTPGVTFAVMLTNLETQKRGRQFLSGKIPRLDRWLAEGLWEQQHDGAEVTDRVAGTIAAAAEIMAEVDR